MDVTCAAVSATLKALTAAATLTVTGTCAPHVTLSGGPAGSVIDFSAAPVPWLDLVGVSGITVEGVVSTGAAYSALNVMSSSNILIRMPHISRPGTAGITIQGSDTIEVAGPWITQSSGDGIDIAGSTNINVHDGTCEDDTVKTALPLCVQEWSVTGHPLQHIFVQNMVTIGKTQGFEIYDKSSYGATDIQFLNNHAAISTTTCISASYADHLVITGNDCHTLPGAPGPAGILVSNSPGAVVSGNTPVTQSINKN